MENKRRIISILDKLLPICEAWIQEKDGQLFFVDPIDNVEISAHYGASHIAASLIIYGYISDCPSVTKKGCKLLDGILNRWDQNKLLPAFHNDFNNFALCVVADHIKRIDVNLYKRIQNTVIQTPDSQHDTTNWLPMRIYVNQKRFEWTLNERYNKITKQYLKKIKYATNNDGGIEDRLPKGTSFNLQYDVATVGVLQFLRLRGIDYNLSKELRFLKKAVLPDGDINYQGRGTNQIFAWGLWIYLLASSCREEELTVALSFLEPKVVGMFNKHNLMLNEYEGEDKYLWWDYHFCSVYCAHFLFWLILSIIDYGRNPVASIDTTSCETGLKVLRSDKSCVASFEGRREYLAERGPVICALWSKSHGMIFKGTFGPWYGAFGNKYTNGDVLRNYIGVIKKDMFTRSESNTFLNSLLSKVPCVMSLLPVSKFCAFTIDLKEGIKISFVSNKTIEGFFNFPIMQGTLKHDDFKLLIDGKEEPLTEVGTIMSQYGILRLYQSNVLEGRVWSIIINC